MGWSVVKNVVIERIPSGLLYTATSTNNNDDGGWYQHTVTLDATERTLTHDGSLMTIEPGLDPEQVFGGYVLDLLANQGFVSTDISRTVADALEAVLGARETKRLSYLLPSGRGSCMAYAEKWLKGDDQLGIEGEPYGDPTSIGYSEHRGVNADAIVSRFLMVALDETDEAHGIRAALNQDRPTPRNLVFAPGMTVSLGGDIVTIEGRYGRASWVIVNGSGVRSRISTVRLNRLATIVA